MSRRTRPQTRVLTYGIWRRHHWQLIGHPEAHGRSFTYRGALRQADRARKILRPLPVAHAKSGAA